MNKKNYRLCKPEDCTGCMACRNICNNDAVDIMRDKLDCDIPTIDENKCVNCGLCTKACPVINKRTDISDEYTKENCYAVWTNDAEDRRTCSSGGVATTLSRYFIKNNGVVFGAAFDEKLSLHHKMVLDENGLESLKGSKYAQSDVRYTYREAKKELNKGKNVLYIGSPCQIAGLYGFLQKKYDNLITVDFICHGVPPNKYLVEHIKSNYPKRNVTSVAMRGENSFQFSVFENDILISRIPSFNDLYFSSFFAGLTFRDNCYKCAYANLNRVSDITIGDFWGYDKDYSPPDERHISVVLLNTIKGINIFNKTKDLFTYQQQSIDDAVAGNNQLRSPVPIVKSRNIFKWLYPKFQFENSVRILYFNTNIKNKLKSTKFGAILRNLKRKVKNKE